MYQIYKKISTGISFAKGRPILDIFCRDEEGEKKVIKVYNLPIYFYVKEDVGFDEEDMKQVISTHDGYTGLFGEKLKKVTIKKISEMRKLGRKYHAYESDIKWDKKCILDLGIVDYFIWDGGRPETLDERYYMKHENNSFDKNQYFNLEIEKIMSENVKEAIMRLKDIIIKPKVCVLDIEVDVKSREELNTFEGEILCIVCWDSATDSYKCLKNTGIEKNLLEEFWKYISNEKFDIFSGWNVSFDINWIMKRSEYYDIDLSPYVGGKSFMKEYTNNQGKFIRDAVIHGHVVLDGMELYKKKTATSEKLASYSLKSVAVVEGLPEWEDLGARIGIEWAKDPDKVLEYCRLDVVNTKDIIYNNDLIRGVEILCNITGAEFSEAVWNSLVIDSMAFLYKDNIILPNKHHITDDSKFKGAVVLKTTSGLHRGVGILDAASMYPSIIDGLNVSTECMLTKKDLTKYDKEDYISLNIDSEEENTGKDKIYLLKKKQRTGLMTKIIMRLRQRREEIRDQRMKALGDENKIKYLNDEEKVLKGLLASVYGVMGFSGFRFYNKDCARVITWVGRNVIQTILNDIEKESCKVIYGDTDSVFIQFTPAEYGFELMDKINELVYSFTKSLGTEEQFMKMNYEKFFKWIMFTKTPSKKLKSKIYKKDTPTAKKKYIGFISHEQSGSRSLAVVNKLYNKGFELRRSSSAVILKKVQKEFFMKMEDGDFEKSIKYLKEVKKTFNRLGRYHLGMPRSVNNEEAKGPYPDGIRYSKKYLGFEFNEDEMPKLLYVKRPIGYPVTNVICYQEHHDIPKEFEIDHDIIFDKIIKAKFEPILETFGLQWDVAIESQNTLDNWF